jgi:AcrR family transcriptional regulator
MDVEPSTSTVRRKVGRPARLSRDAIIAAAHELGYDNLTMQTVADHLGVSVPSLYHYVRGKDDLLRLAAEASAERIQIPRDHGQHWAVWLYEWAMYNRDAFVAQPGLVRQFMEGMIASERTADSLDRALGTLVNRGFTIYEAWSAYGIVSEFAIGAAVGEIREREATAEGRSAVAEFQRVLADRGRNELPHLRALLEPALTAGSSSFEANLVTVLRGIAAVRGERWGPIETRLRRFMSGHTSTAG